jgi:hypothetical protein
MDIKEMRCDDVNWIQVALDRVMFCALLCTVVDLDQLGDCRLLTN